jgi:ribosomal protein L37E
MLIVAACCAEMLKLNLEDRDYMDIFKMNAQSTDVCKHCGVGRLRRWSELGEEEQEVVRRLPASADFSLQERKRTHKWCARCWHESFMSAPDNA